LWRGFGNGCCADGKNGWIKSILGNVENKKEVIS
jgi:hypothetical protein